MPTTLRRIVLPLLGIAVLLPFVSLLLWAFSARWFYPDLFPGQWGLRAWRYLWGPAGGHIVSALATSIGLSAAVALLAVLIGIPAGRILGLYRFRGKWLVLLIVLLPIIVPPFTVAMGIHLWFLKLGLAETVAGVMFSHLTVCLPYAVFVLWGVFSRYNTEFEDQARSLGAGRWMIWRQVMLPLIGPGVIVAALFAFLLSWGQYLATLIIGGGRVVTLPIVLFALIGGSDRPVAAVVSLLLVMPAMAALLVSARFLGRRGMIGIW